MITEFSSVDVKSLTFTHTDDGLLVEARIRVGTPGCSDKILCARWLLDDVAYLSAKIENIVTKAQTYDVGQGMEIRQAPRVEGSSLEMTFAARLKHQGDKVLSKFWFEDDTPGPASTEAVQ